MDDGCHLRGGKNLHTHQLAGLVATVRRSSSAPDPSRAIQKPVPQTDASRASRHILCSDVECSAAHASRQGREDELAETPTFSVEVMHECADRSYHWAHVLRDGEHDEWRL